ncbi:MAG: hypothetical protein HY749_19285 [Gammaproteobacteria bacterium]|nr:hypothetical protein [Gammaproteobacteria bacterium]
MSELVVMPTRSTRTIVEQYLGEHLAGLDVAADVPETTGPAILPVASAAAVDEAVLVPAPETDAAPVADAGSEAAASESMRDPEIPMPVASSEPVSAALPEATPQDEAPASIPAEEPPLAVTAPAAASDPSAMISFRVGPLRFALPQFALASAASDTAVEIDVVALVPAAYAAIAAAGRGGESVALSAGIVVTGVHVDGVMNVTPDEIRPRTNRGSEPWIAGTTLKPARFILDVEALAQMFGRQ